MKVLLVDDEQLQLLRLENACKKVMPDAELFSYTNPLKAAEENATNDIDLAFLDIEMPGINGIQLAKKLKKNHPSVRIIFVTAYHQYALDAFKVHASGYLSKPVSEDKIKEELKELTHEPIELASKKPIQIKCFGNFEIFHDGQPIKFKRSKSKELIAYLVDREGSAITTSELNAVLWEEDHPSYLRNLFGDIQGAFAEIGVEGVFIKRHNECYIDISKVDCDAYEYKKGNPNAVRMYRGEYMVQYPWAVFDANI